MSRSYSVDDGSVAHNEHEIAHLSWSHTGNELAVINFVGQISIYNIFIAINRVINTRRCALDAEDHLSAVIGLSWLHNNRPVQTLDS